MSYAKVFDNFEWVDQEDGETTPLSAANLNLINTALNLIDNRVIEILNGPFAAHVSSLDALGIIRTNLLAAHTAGGIITVSDDTCFSKDVEVEGDLSLAGSLAFQNVGTNTISSPTALTVTTPVSLTLNATSGIELSTGSGKATYNGSEIALKSDLPNSYSAAWTATASSAYGTQLSNSITVPSGLYLLSFRTPYSTDTTTAMIGLGGFSSAITTFIGGSDVVSMNPSQDEKTMIVRFSATATVYIGSKASAQMTWDSSYLARGGLVAIRLAD